MAAPAAPCMRLPAAQKVPHTPCHRAQVPLLNDVEAVEQLRPGSLVRFRCMAQYTYNPEMFAGEYDHVNGSTGERVRVHAQYCDAMDVPPGFTADMADQVIQLMERLPVHCMSIPHESSWVSQSTRGGMEIAHALQRAKRSRGDDSMDEERPAGPSLPPSHSSQSAMDCEGCDDENIKRLRASAAASETSTAAHAAGGRPDLVPGAPHVKHAAIVKVYHDAASVKVNEAYEFVGILCCDPVLEEAGQEVPGMVCGFVEDAQAAAVRTVAASTGPASSSVIPRLHAVTFRQLSPSWNPALDLLSPAEQALRRTALMSALTTTRARVVNSLKSALMGDGLAAEYLLCHMLSRVYHRVSEMPVGKFSLAITGLPAAAAAGTSTTKELVAVMQGLRPAVAYVPMSIKNMNSKLMVPKMNFDTEMLHTGDLQVAPATQIICDETAMEDGQLDEKGLKNLHCLQQLATFQHILFDFNFDWMKFPTDVPVLVMSQGRAKPLMKTDVVVKLTPDGGAAAILQGGTEESPEVQELCRIYMGLARALDVGVDNEVEQMVPNSFVEARKVCAGMSGVCIGCCSLRVRCLLFRMLVSVGSWLSSKRPGSQSRHCADMPRLRRRTRRCSKRTCTAG
jgi:hypothetical protein